MSYKPHDYLTRGMSKEEKEEFQKLYSDANRVIKRIVELMEKRLERNRTEMEAETIYDTPNYVLKVSDNAGYRRCLKDLIQMVKPSDKRTT